MHNVWLIAQREYIARVRTRGFIITTVMIPLVMVGFIVGSLFLGTHQNMDRRIVVVSSDLPLAQAMQDELQKAPADAADATIPTPSASPLSLRAAARSPKFTVDVMRPATNTRATLDRNLDDNQIDGYLWIEPPTPNSPATFAYTPRSSSDQVTSAAVTGALNRVLLRRQLAHRGVASPEADALMQSVEVHTLRESRHRDRASSMISIGVLFFLMYFVIMLYGMNVARSIIEEKTSRIFEVLLSAVRPEEMMAGKILGVGAVGLTQVGIWLASILIAVARSHGISIGGELIQPSFTGQQLAYFLVFFLLGYLFYSCIAAALGAMANSEQELQQMNIFLMLPLIFCFIAVGTMITTPDSNIARVLALIPPFTPLLMYARVSLGHPATWEVALSIALLTASIAVLIWLTSRIYRVGVLMYGKRPTVVELMRWLKYS
ncbi:MAG TPA: ABC transporter permease [Acidobacteriaceae bacterium]